MTEISGDLHIVDYKTKMVIASLKPEDYIEDLRHWELKDNADILDIKLLDESPFLIYFQQKNLILKETRSGVITPYVITEIAKDSAAHTATVYASGEWIKLDKDAYISPQKITSKDAAYYMNFATARTIWEVGVIEAVGTRTMTIDTFISPLRFIKEVATLFDNVEIQYRIVMNPTKPPTRYIDLVKKRGRETDKEIILGKDLLGIKRIENSENIITALVPFVMGRDADGNDKLITIESVNNGLQYIVDEAAYQRWNVDGKHLFGFYTPETDNEDMAPARLLTLAKTELKKRVDTIVSYEVDSVDISRVFGYEHEAVGEGDTIRIIDEGMTPTLYLEARAVAGDESRKDKRKSKYTFGNFVEIINPDEALRKLYQKMLTMIGDKVPKEWFGALETKLEETKKKADTAVEESQSAKDLAEATKDYMDQNMVDIIESVNPPTANLKPNKTLWRDISGGNPGILKIWTGTAWESVVPDTGPLQQSIKDAQTEINTLKGTVKDLPDKTWLNQQIEGKADKEGVYTKDWVNNNLIGKQVYETNRKGDIEKLTETTTIAERTAEEIKSKVEKTVVTQLGNDLANVSKTANTAKQTAESNTNIITSLQTTVSNINDNVINLLVDSGTFEGAKTTTPTAIDRWWFKNNDIVKLSMDTYQGNAVIETQSSWNALAYSFKDLVSRGVVKAGDKVNFSIFTRLKGAGSGVELGNTFFFTTEATGITVPKSTNQWKRVSVTFTVTTAMMTLPGTSTESFFRIEPDANPPVNCWYQQSTPQLTIGDKVYTWRPAPEDASTIVKKSNEIKQTVDSNVATISKVEKEQGTMQSTLNKVEQTTNSNSQNITTLTQTQGQQGPIIQQNTSDITQLNNQIKSKVSDTQMQDYVGGLGSTNVLFNAAFEDRVINATTGIVTSRTPSTTKWSTVGVGSGITIVPENARHHDGYNSVKITATGQTTAKWAGVMQRVSAVQNGGDYVFSAWIYVQDKNTLDVGGAIKLQFFNGSNAVSTFVQTEIKDLLANNAWTLVSVKITSPNVAITHLQGDIWVRQNGTMWVSQPQLQQGSTPSTFMENPKDYANYDQLVGEVAKKVATSDFNSKVSTIETSINQQSNRIDLKVEKNDVYNKIDSDGRYGSKAIVESHTSTLSVMSNEINLRVKSGDVASTINQTAQSVLIQADKIYLNGFIEAKHLKAQELVGVTIKTAPNGQQRYVKLNQQNIELYDKDTVRAEFRFFNKSDGTAINPTLTLGRSVSGGIVGALNLTQWTPINAQGVDDYKNSQGTIGLVEQYNSNSNEFTYGSRINFFQGGAMDLKANDNLIINASQKGYIWLKTDSIGTNTDIFIEPSKDFKVTAGNNTVINSKGYFDSTSESGRHYFGKKDKPSTQNHMQLYDNNSDADLSLAFLRLRASHVTGYTSGFQIKNATGDEFRDLEARNIKCVSLQQTSTRLIKTGIKDIEISSLEKIMGLKTQQYYFKSDMDKLYKIREDRVEGDPLPTIADIPLQYGFIAEDSDIAFTTDDKTAINLYPVVALTVDSVQYIKLTQDEHGTRITQLEVELEVRKLEKVEQDKQIAELKELVQTLIDKKPEQP